MQSTRFGIRYRISVVMLLAALNSVALFAVAVVLFSSVAQAPPSQLVNDVLNAQGLVDLAHESMLTADLSQPQARQEVRRSLDSAQDIVSSISPVVPSVGADLATYREAADRYLNQINANPSATSGTDPQLAEDEAVTRRTYHHLRGSMLLAISAPRPAWVEQAIPILPWAMAWVVLVGGVTMVGAWSLRSILSKPLAELAAAAGQLANGNLNAPIPTNASAPEIAVLAKAMRSARDNLVNALREREARSVREQAILAHMSDGVLLLDHLGTVLQLNPTAEQLLWQLIPLGLEPQTGHPVWHLVKEIDEALLARREPAELEAMRVAPGHDETDARTWVAITLRPVPPITSQDPGGFVLMLRDITAQRELDQLQREFLSVVTHELKTPLTAIEGYARLLLRGKAGPLAPRQHTFVETIAAQSAVLKNMVQNLLDTSRLEDGQLPIDQQAVDLAQLVQDLATTWSGSAATHNVELAIDIPAGEDAQIWVDSFRMQQVIGNLVGNALKFTAGGGRITLRALTQGDEALIEVEDTGRGIPPEKLLQVFGKFFQVERGDTRVAGGTGLGLYICKQLVEAMGGTITVRSQRDVGSCFTIRLPLHHDPPDGART
ncbi:MAG: HAMP domain-containing protein [Oligoflexia bacterium]|nr:HAMP domain-containing protein [Oligoflexia bacterium]